MQRIADFDITIIRNHLLTKANLCVLLVSLFALTGLAHGERFDAKFTGSSFDIGIDVDPPDGIFESAGNLQFQGKSNLLGKFTARGAGRVNPFSPPPVFCDAPPRVLLTWQIHQLVFTAANADQFYTVLADGPGSELCVDPSSQTNAGIIRVVIIGGSGRFSQATGQLEISTSGRSIRNTTTGISVGGAFTGTIAGEISL